MVGQTISHYKILDKLGEGGMGVVYKAEDTSLDRIVALKLLAPHLLQHPDARTRFVREAKAAAALEHPNICMVFEAGEADGQTFLAMSFVDGESLGGKIERRPLKLDEALGIAIQIAEGLQAAHEKGIVHRDIKPGNVMLTARGQAKIMDFGLAQLSRRTRLTKSGTTLGTPAYMSPEQVRGEAVDRRTDIWSFGVVLYEMITGRLPFQGDTDQAVSYGIVNEEPEPLTAVRSGVPMDLDRVINKALAKTPNQRYQHVDELLVDLRALRQQQESGTHETVVAVAPRRSKALVALVVVIIGTVALVSWLAGSGGLWKADPITFVRLTTKPGMEYHPSFSPRGDEIAYAWHGPNRDNFDIWVQRIGGGGESQLTTGPANEFSPAWSPDGNRIAFLRETSDGRTTIVLIPPRGGPERQLADDAAGYSVGAYGVGFHTGPFLTWSPDGQWLVALIRTKPRGPSQLVAISPETLERRILTSPTAWGERAPAFSPGGRSLAFLRPKTGSVSEVHIVTLSTSLAPEDERQITDLGNMTGSVVWSADGRNLLFTSTKFDSHQCYRIPADGTGEPEPIRLLGESPFYLAIAWDASRLAYTNLELKADLWAFDLQDSESGAPVEKLLIGSSRREWSPTFSPDGMRIAFGSSRSGAAEIWAANTDGNDQFPLTSMNAITNFPAWSPDGRWVAFDARVGGVLNVYVVSSDGGSPQQITDTPHRDGRPAFSADGRWIYFRSDRSGEFSVWRVPFGGGEPTRVTNGASFGPIRLSRDGRFLYYTRPGSHIWRALVDRPAEEERITRGGSYCLTDDGLFVEEWFPERRRILKHHDIGSGVSREVLSFSDLHIGIGGFAVSRDGRTVVHTKWNESNGDLVLAENFR